VAASSLEHISLSTFNSAQREYLRISPAVMRNVECNQGVAILSS
jgi:hypothetical protein